MKICRIRTALRDCEVKMWRPSGLSSSVILSSAFSSLVLPSTWQSFLLHSWLYNLSLSPSQSCVYTPACACVCVYGASCMCACLPNMCGCVCVSQLRIYGAFWHDLWNDCSYFIVLYQTNGTIWPMCMCRAVSHTSVPNLWWLNT